MITNTAFISHSQVSYSQFQKVCFTVGQAVHVAPNPTAIKPSYLISLNVGATLIEEHTKNFNENQKKISKRVATKDYTSSAQLCSNHRIEDIFGKQLLTVINFPIKQIGKMMSECLVTGVQKETSDEVEKRESTVFMQPSTSVALGSKVGLLAEECLIETNPRDLAWPDFSLLDLRIGTIAKLHDLTLVTENINQMLFSINFGECDQRTCIGRFCTEFNGESLVGKQVLTLTNLDLESKKNLFSISQEEESYAPSEDDVILCTVGGKAVLEPALPVENGFKLA